MITFVVNLHSGIPSMALAEPFLYPLKKEKRLHLIFPSAANQQERLQLAVQEIKRVLERSTYIQWQLVFLIPIQNRQQSAWQSSLSAYMHLIRSEVLKSSPLQQYPNPSNIYCIAIDHVNDDEAIPNISDPVYRNSWELDTHGFIKDAKNFFISQQQLQQLDTIWRNNVAINSNVIVNLGFDGLPHDVQQQVNKAISQIATQADEWLSPKNIQLEHYKISHQLHYLTYEDLEQIANEFALRLDNTRKDPSRYLNFSPANALKSAIAQHIGIFSNDNKDTYRLIRFPVKITHENVLQRYLVKLSVLLHLIAEEEAVIKNLSKKNYRLQVDLNDYEVQKLSYTHFEQLHNMEQRFENKLNKPAPVSLKLLDDSNCGCTESLEKTPPEMPTFGFLRYNGDLVKWKNWTKDTDEKIKDYDRRAKQKMQTCINKSYKTEAEATTMEISNIGKKLNELQLQRQQLQEKVEHDFLSTHRADDWLDFQEQQTKLLSTKLLSRPTRNEVVLLIFLSILVYFIPNLYIGVPIAYSVVILTALLLSMLAFWLARRKYRKQIFTLVLQSFEKARSMRMNINDEFERQKAYLKSLCQFNIVRTNYKEAKKADKIQHKTNLLLDYHRRQLAEHKTMAKKVLQIFGGDTQNNQSDFNEQLPIPDIDKPVHINEIYAPSTFLPSNVREEQRAVSIDNITYPINNKLGKLIEQISFTKDMIYSEDTNFG